MNQEMSEAPIAPPQKLIAAVAAARRIAVLTGAGMSAESGIPTFRDKLTGLWGEFDVDLMATRSGFLSNPAKVWAWYEACRRAVSGIAPNAGHTALRDLACLDSIEEFTIVTQNVDDLHERAGSKDIFHVHGRLFATRCLDCGRPATEPKQHLVEPSGTDLREHSNAPPLCLACRGLRRPDVVWFGERLPVFECQQALVRVSRADLLLVVGTSGLVYPVAALPKFASDEGCQVWQINPDPADLSCGESSSAASAATALPRLINGLQ